MIQSDNLQHDRKKFDSELVENVDLMTVEEKKTVEKTDKKAVKYFEALTRKNRLTPTKVPKQRGGNTGKKEKIKGKEIEVLARTKGNNTKLQIETLENASNGGNKIVNLKQESIKTFLKSSKKYKDTFRGCLSNQSHSTDDGPERAVQGPNMEEQKHQPI